MVMYYGYLYKPAKWGPPRFDSAPTSLEIHAGDAKGRKLLPCATFKIV